MTKSLRDRGFSARQAAGIVMVYAMLIAWTLPLTMIQPWTLVPLALVLTLMGNHVARFAVKQFPGPEPARRPVPETASDDG